jgi:hypothetical protein
MTEHAVSIDNLYIAVGLRLEIRIVEMVYSDESILSP